MKPKPLSISDADREGILARFLPLDAEPPVAQRADEADPLPAGVRAVSCDTRSQ